jgi:hypothetical protein
MIEIGSLWMQLWRRSALAMEIAGCGNTGVEIDAMVSPIGALPLSLVLRPVES